MSLKFKTPAKINLGLHISGKRQDGFHELETLFQMVDLFDEVEVESTPGDIRVFCDHPEIPDGPENLAYRSAKILKDHCPGDYSGVTIKIKKRIPAGGGLGGGSGNAAGVLLALNLLWNLKLSRTQLMDFASQLGSDIPFFLFGACALGRGRGERLSHLQPSKKFNVILINPRFPISTPWVYSQLNLKLTKGENNISILQKFFSQSDISNVGAHLTNDLEPVVIKRFPEIQHIKNRLSALGSRGSLLSGSGSTVFGIFDDPQMAEAAYEKLRDEKWDLFNTQTVGSLTELYPKEMIDFPE